MFRVDVLVQGLGDPVGAQSHVEHAAERREQKVLKERDTKVRISGALLSSSSGGH